MNDALVEMGNVVEPANWNMYFFHYFLALKYKIDIYKKYLLCNEINKYKLYHRIAQKQIYRQ